MAKKIRFVETRAEVAETRLGPLEANEVLIKARCSLISPGTERAALTRLWDDAAFRENPGYALAGDVVAVGAGVEDLEVGERVVSLMNHSSHAVAPAVPWMVLPLPDSLSYEHATFSTLASVALHALRRLDLTFGEEEVSISFHAEFIRRELSLIAAFQPFCPVEETAHWRWTQQANRRLALEMLASGELQVEEMLTHRFPADEAPRVYERIKAVDRDMLGVLLQWL